MNEQASTIYRVAGIKKIRQKWYHLPIVLPYSYC